MSVSLLEAFAYIMDYKAITYFIYFVVGVLIYLTAHIITTKARFADHKYFNAFPNTIV